jgi:hypothetical protein
MKIHISGMSGGEICIIFSFYQVKTFLFVCLTFSTMEFIKMMIQKLSCFLTVNTLLLSYKDKYINAVYGTNHCSPRESYRTDTYTLRTNLVYFKVKAGSTYNMRMVVFFWVLQPTFHYSYFSVFYTSLLLECIIFEFTGSWCKEQLDTYKSSLDVQNQKEIKL